MATKQDPLYLQAFRFAQDVATGRHWLSRLIPPVLILLDAALCVLVIAKVAYTEIDWTAYMEQVQLFLDGERDYTKIEGGTGPLVYPAAHVYIYTGLYYLTNHGKDILLAQQLFAGLYLVNLAVVMSCYWKAKAPPYVFPLLILSKRLHSIFMLRCFNDCFAVFFMWLSILLLQHRQWVAGGLIYSFGLGVKMTLLLVLPVVGILIFFAKGVVGTIALGGLMAGLQAQLAVPFLKHPGAYFGRAFEFSRQFLFKWTVNWRFVGEETFLSRAFSTSLLALHVSVLLTFIFTRWLPPTGKSLGDVLKATLSPDSRGRNWQPLFRAFTPKYILTTILTANVVGLLFARSLHYQFYSYLAWSTPYLLWRGGLHPVLQYVLWALQEWAWNVFPSTPLSSAVVVGVMAITVTAVWFGTSDEAASSAAPDPSVGHAGAPTRSIRKP
ncbi:dolichyl-P-Man:Man(5)GlcNAc(2)-PP-dolichol alpha-1,3-mannosyltransferase [Diaporthe eres]